MSTTLASARADNVDIEIAKNDGKYSIAFDNKSIRADLHDCSNRYDIKKTLGWLISCVDGVTKPFYLGRPRDDDSGRICFHRCGVDNILVISGRESITLKMSSLVKALNDLSKVDPYSIHGCEAWKNGTLTLLRYEHAEHYCLEITQTTPAAKISFAIEGYDHLHALMDRAKNRTRFFGCLVEPELVAEERHDFGGPLVVDLGDGECPPVVFQMHGEYLLIVHRHCIVIVNHETFVNMLSMVIQQFSMGVYSY